MSEASHSLQTFEELIYTGIRTYLRADSYSPHLSQSDRNTALLYNERLSAYLTRINRANSKTKKSAALDLLKNLWVYEHDKQHTYDIFESFFKFEPMLFRDQDYRDHFFHQINVFMLGFYLINKLLSNQRICQEFEFSENINFTWLLTSTFHDIGYPIHSISNWMTDFFQDFMGTRSLYQVSLDAMLTQNFYDYVKHLAAFSYAREAGMQLPIFGVGSAFTDWRLYDQLLVELKNKNHGVISALLLMHRILTQERFAKLQGYLKADFPKQICTAAHAICLHDLQSQQACFKTNPFGALLILCDELQDEGRPCASPKPHARLVDLDVNLDGQKPTVKCYLKIPNSAVKGQKSAIKNRVTMNGYFDVELLNIDDNSLIAHID